MDHIEEKLRSLDWDKNLLKAHMEALNKFEKERADGTINLGEENHGKLRKLQIMEVVRNKQIMF